MASFRDSRKLNIPLQPLLVPLAIEGILVHLADIRLFQSYSICCGPFFRMDARHWTVYSNTGSQWQTYQQLSSIRNILLTKQFLLYN